MPYLHQFDRDEIFVNRIQTHPECTITLYSGSQFINNRRFAGENIMSGSDTGISSSYLSLFELNVDRVKQSYYDYGDPDNSTREGPAGGQVRASVTPGSVYGLGTPQRGAPIATARASASYAKITSVMVKDGSMWRFRNMTDSTYSQLTMGTLLTSSYPYTSSIQRDFIPGGRTLPYREFPRTPGTTDPVGSPWGDVINHTANPDPGFQSTDVYFSQSKQLIALRNTLDWNAKFSPAYAYSSSVPTDEAGVHKPFLTGAVGLVSVPSIFYGSQIEKGSVRLEFYYTGSLLDVAKDEKRNGELMSTMGDTSGSIVGVVLYTEGFVLLTSTTPITTHPLVTDSYLGTGSDAGGGTQQSPNWTYFGSYNTGTFGRHANDTEGNYAYYPSASLFKMFFRGTNHVPTLTMFANAVAGDLNNSQNPTWISSSFRTWRERIQVTSGTYIEPQHNVLKNTIQSDYCEFEDEFEKQVFISKIGIFDKDKNLIGIAKLANPVLKKETEAYTFKLKMDF